ncbi:hypothetical protein [Deinococcus sp.]|uniref:hypothetical protein n=1 Tax=Deinococcus sp. TaxID=47478 RepID=UPI0025B818BE|nr:hypothetical protein [Deinococcus sp.]
MKFSRLLLCPLLLCGLTACGGGSPGTAAAGVASSGVEGAVLYPPSTGTVTLEFDMGAQQLRPLVHFPVDRRGLYTITLPVPPQLSAGGQAEVLPLLPALDLLGFSRSQCPGGLKLSDSAARFAVVSSAYFVPTGAATAATLRLAGQAMAGQNTQTINLWRQYAYADRTVHLSGTQTCTLSRSDSSSQSAQIDVDYQLRQGWNVLVIQTVQDGTAPLTGRATVASGLSGVQWHYVPPS